MSPSPDRTPPGVLLAGADRIGDLLLVTPAIRRLRESRPDLRTVVLTTPVPADLVRGNPNVDAVVAVPRGTGSLGRWLYVRRALEALGGERPRLSAVFAFRDRPVYRAIAKRLDVPYDATGILDPARTGHYTARATACLAPLGVTPSGPGPLEVFVTAADRAEAARVLGGLGIAPDRPLAVLQVGSRATRRGYFTRPAPSDRDWPAERFADLAQALAAGRLEEIGPIQVLLHAATAPERRVARRIARTAGRTIAPAPLPTRVLAALLERADLVVSPDTGTMHIATAVRVPVVAIFGPSDPAFTGPAALPGRAAIVRPRRPGVPARAPAEAVLEAARFLLLFHRSACYAHATNLTMGV